MMAQVFLRKKIIRQFKEVSESSHFVCCATMNEWDTNAQIKIILGIIIYYFYEPIQTIQSTYRRHSFVDFTLWKLLTKEPDFFVSTFNRTAASSKRDQVTHISGTELNSSVVVPSHYKSSWFSIKQSKRPRPICSFSLFGMHPRRRLFRSMPNECIPPFFN